MQHALRWIQITYWYITTATSSNHVLWLQATGYFSMKQHLGKVLIQKNMTQLGLKRMIPGYKVAINSDNVILYITIYIPQTVSALCGRFPSIDHPRCLPIVDSSSNQKWIFLNSKTSSNQKWIFLNSKTSSNQKWIFFNCKTPSNQKWIFLNCKLYPVKREYISLFQNIQSSFTVLLW